LWNGGTVTSYTKVSGDDWLDVDAHGTVSGTAPADVPQHPGVITVEATDGTTTSDITVEVPVIGATDAPQLATATWNLWDAGTHVDDALLKDLAVIGDNGLDVIGVQEDGGTVAHQLAQALGWYDEESADGVGIVSAYPISDLVAATAQAPAVGASVDVLGRDVRVWSAGLDPTDATTRHTQAQAVAAEVHGDVTGTAPVVLLGDLESSAEAAVLTDAGLTDSFREKSQDAGDTLLFASPSDRVDYVDYAGSALTVLGSNTLVAGWPTTADPASAWTSDHRAVVTTFTLGTGVTTPPPAPTVTVANRELAFQVGHGVSTAQLTADLGVTTDPADATVTVDDSAVDYATEGDYTALVTATEDGVASDPVSATVHVVPVVALSLARTSATFPVGSVGESDVLTALGATLNVSGVVHADLGAVDAATPGSYPVTVTGTDGWGFSATRQATVVIAGAPVVTVTASPAAPDGANGWYVSTPTLTATAAGGTGVTTTLEIRVDGGGWTPYAGAVSVPDGVHSYDLRATNDVGTVSAVVTVPVEVDRAAPTTVATATPGADVDAPVTVSLAATDALSGVGSTQYRIGDGAWTTYAAPFTVTPAAAAQQVSYRSTDRAGNVEAAGHLVVGAGDLTAPVVTAAVAPAAPDGVAGWYLTAPRITATATDDATAAPRIEYRVGDGAWTAYDGALVAPDGRWVYEFRATDAVGNTSAAVSVPVDVDHVAPTSSARVTGFLRGGWYTGGVRVTLAAADAISGVAAVHVRVDGGTPAIYRGPLALGAGVHQVSYEAVDQAGNIGALHTLTLRVDGAAPTVAATLRHLAQHGHGPRKARWRLTIAAGDSGAGVATVEYRVGKGRWKAYRHPVTLRPGRRPAWVAYRATDAVGQVSVVRRVRLPGLRHR
jgi:endonuclease/exonuclease/phosphatase family metal-dependent hydrolase